MALRPSTLMPLSLTLMFNGACHGLMVDTTQSQMARTIYMFSTHLNQIIQAL